MSVLFLLYRDGVIMNTLIQGIQKHWVQWTFLLSSLFDFFLSAGVKSLQVMLSFVCSNVLYLFHPLLYQKQQGIIKHINIFSQWSQHLKKIKKMVKIHFMNIVNIYGYALSTYPFSSPHEPQPHRQEGMSYTNLLDQYSLQTLQASLVEYTHQMCP